MKIPAVLLAASLALCPAIMAQRPGGDGDRNPMRLLNQYFAFDEAQQAQLTDLMTARHDTVEPLMIEIGQNRAAIRDLLNQADPDAAAIGDLMIANHDLEGLIGDAQQAFADGFQAMLNEEQAQKYVALARAKRLVPVVRAAEALRLPLRPPAPPDEG